MSLVVVVVMGVMSLVGVGAGAGLDTETQLGSQIPQSLKLDWVMFECMARCGTVPTARNQPRVRTSLELLRRTCSTPLPLAKYISVSA